MENELNVTLDQMEDFKMSIIWYDMVKELEFWKQGFEYEMKSIVDNAAENNPSSASVLLHMGDINGRLKAVDYILGMPDMFISLLKIKKENKDGRDQTD